MCHVFFTYTMIHCVVISEHNNGLYACHLNKTLICNSC
jgi:hypothetical protein